MMLRILAHLMRAAMTWSLLGVLAAIPASARKKAESTPTKHVRLGKKSLKSFSPIPLPNDQDRGYIYDLCVGTSRLGRELHSMPGNNGILSINKDCTVDYLTRVIANNVLLNTDPVSFIEKLLDPKSITELSILLNIMQQVSTEQTDSKPISLTNIGAADLEHRVAEVTAKLTQLIEPLRTATPRVFLDTAGKDLKGYDVVVHLFSVNSQGVKKVQERFRELLEVGYADWGSSSDRTCRPFKEAVAFLTRKQTKKAAGYKFKEIILEFFASKDSKKAVEILHDLESDYLARHEVLRYIQSGAHEHVGLYFALEYVATAKGRIGPDCDEWECKMLEGFFFEKGPAAKRLETLAATPRYLKDLPPRLLYKILLMDSRWPGMEPGLPGVIEVAMRELAWDNLMQMLAAACRARNEVFVVHILSFMSEEEKKKCAAHIAQLGKRHRGQDSANKAEDGDVDILA
ncbi:hypothetical protein PAPHI01_2453 [Pancytospora philotis]|nr:hypothetical protein PAPHI01_2453 [Pancytospora philotis]